MTAREKIVALKIHFKADPQRTLIGEIRELREGRESWRLSEIIDILYERELGDEK